MLRIREECVCIREIVTAEKIKHHWLRKFQLRSRPITNFPELLPFKIVEGGAKGTSVLTPDIILRQILQWKIDRKRYSGKKHSGIAVAGGLLAYGHPDAAENVAVARF
jgi:hypothetical protein